MFRKVLIANRGEIAVRGPREHHAGRFRLTGTRILAKEETMQTTLDVVVRDKGSDELITVPASAMVAEAVAAMTEREVGAVLIMNEDGQGNGQSKRANFHLCLLQNVDW